MLSSQPIEADGVVPQQAAGNIANPRLGIMLGGTYTTTRVVCAEQLLTRVDGDRDSVCHPC